MLQISAMEFLLYETADETRWWAERGAIAELFTMRVSRFIRVNSPRAGAAAKRWFNAAFNYLHLAFKQPSSVKCVFEREHFYLFYGKNCRIGFNFSFTSERHILSPCGW